MRKIQAIAPRQLYKIERDIPMPYHRGQGPKQDMKGMEIGESFFVPNCSKSEQSSLLKSARDQGVRITSRERSAHDEPEYKSAGRRFWRFE